MHQQSNPNDKKTVEVVQTLTADKIYRDQFRSDAIHNYRQQRADGTYATSPEQCAIERNIQDACRTSLHATQAKYEQQVAAKRVEQAELDMGLNAIDKALNQFRREAQTLFAQKRNESQDIVSDLAKIENDIRVKDTTDNIGREPIPSTLDEVAKLALPVAALEALVGVGGFMSGGMSTIDAIIGSCTVAAVNVGLAGYIGGGILFPLCFAHNSGKLKWLATSALSSIAALTLVVNLKAWQVRAALGIDASSPTLETDSLVAHMIGGSLCLIGLGMAGFWAHKFATARDLNIAYGALGSARAELKAQLLEPANECRQSLNRFAETASTDIQAINQKAQSTVNASEQHHLQAEQISQTFEQAQDGLIAEYERVVDQARTDGHLILEQYTPQFFGTSPDFSQMRRPTLSIEALKARLDRHQTELKQLQVAALEAESQIETERQVFEDRINQEFGS